jgi:RNA recognition motif-containing protein
MNIYVSNLDLQTKDDQLNALFAQHGEVSSAKVIMDKFTGTSRGFAFVEMPQDAEGAKAIEQLNNQDFAGKKLSVSVARPREDRQGSYPAGNSFKKRF